VETIVMARHAETEWNVRGALNGDPSVHVPLTDRGRDQARALGRAAGPVDRVAHTRFARTRETAELAWPGAPAFELPELDEIAFGRWEGSAWNDGYAEWAHTTAPEEDPPGGGESRTTAVARYVRGYRRLLELPDRRVALVAHGAQLAYVLLGLQGRRPAPVLPGVPPAVAFVVDRARFAEAIAVVEDWLREPAWS
jgi:probable phosphoglycerate mutase